MHKTVHGVIVIVHHGNNNVPKCFGGGKRVLEKQQQYRDGINDNLPNPVQSRNRLVRLLALSEL